MAQLTGVPNQDVPVVEAPKLIVSRPWLLFFNGLFTSAVQTGSVFLYAGTTPPAGYLLANGQTVSRATFSSLNALAAAVKYASPWGAGDTVATFSVPNLANVSGCVYIIKT